MGALIGAIILIAILLIGSVLVANFIWDTTHNLGVGDSDIELIYATADQYRYDCEVKYGPPFNSMNQQFAYNECMNNVNTWELNSFEGSYQQPIESESSEEIKQNQKFQEMKIVLKNSSTDELIEIYKSCESPSYKYPSVSCINLLNKITNVICEKHDADNPTCFTKTQSDILADKPIRALNPGINHWNNVVYTCNASEGMSLSASNPEMKQCICRYDFGVGTGPWNEICP